MSLLHLVRHAIAADPEPGQRDFDRPLTEEGIDRMRKVARGMKRAGLVPEVVVSSPLVRALRTAEILVEELDIEPEVRVCPALQPGGAVEELLSFLEETAKGQDVAAVGHMPGIAEHLAALVAAPTGVRVDFRKGGIAIVAFDDGALRPGGGTLQAFLTPKLLRSMGG
jgi:phosphohistidine phosphatase